MMTEDVKKQFDKIKVGDILVGSFHYTMSFYDFFEVKAKTASSLRIQKLKKEPCGSSGFMEPNVRPVIGKYDGDIVLRRPDHFGVITEDSMRIHIDNIYDPKSVYAEDHWD